MKRVFTFTIIAALAAAFLYPNAAQALERSSWRYDECRYRHGGGFSTREVKKELRCAGLHFHVRYDTIRCVMQHESGFNEFNTNPYSTAAGLFQTVVGTWGTIYRTQDRIRRWWHLPDSPSQYEGGVSPGVFNARTHAVLVVRRIAHTGWSAWRNFARYTCPGW